MNVGASSSGAEQWLTPGQVAVLFDVNPKTITRWARAGKIGFTRTVGGHRRYRSSEIYVLLRASQFIGEDLAGADDGTAHLHPRSIPAEGANGRHGIRGIQPAE